MCGGVGEREGRLEGGWERGWEAGPKVPPHHLAAIAIFPDLFLPCHLNHLCHLPRVTRPPGEHRRFVLLTS